MPRPKPEDRVRINLELSAETNRQLEALVERADAQTRTEVIRRALRVYDALLEIEEEGGSTTVERSNGDVMLLKLIG